MTEDLGRTEGPNCPLGDRGAQDKPCSVTARDRGMG